MRRIIIKNKSNRAEKLELTLNEFKNKFSKELNSAIAIFTKDCEKKDMLKPPFMAVNNDYESDFYRDLRWNFNNNARTHYYIEKIEY